MKHLMITISIMSIFGCFIYGAILLTARPLYEKYFDYDLGVKICSLCSCSSIFLLLISFGMNEKENKK